MTTPRSRSARLQHHVLQSLLAVRPLERLYAGQSRRDGGGNVLVRQVVLPGLGESERPETARLFEQHFSRLATLTQPGTLPLRERLDAGHGPFYLVQEAPVGTTLGELIRTTERLSVGAAARLTVDIIDLLLHARAAGVHHYGLHRGNVLVGARGAVALLDLGLVPFILERLSGRLQRVHAAWDSLFPDPPALAPEVIVGEPLGDFTDVYGVGALLYLMLTGTLPYGGSAMLAYNAIIAGRTPCDPRLLVADIPTELGVLVEACLRRDPAARPASLEAIRAPLASVAQPLEEAIAPFRHALIDRPWLERFQPLLRLVDKDGDGSLPVIPPGSDVVVPLFQPGGRPFSEPELLARMSNDQRRIYLAGGSALGVPTRRGETRRGLLLGVAVALIIGLFFAPKILSDFGLLDSEGEGGVNQRSPAEAARRRAAESFDAPRERRGPVLYLTPEE